MPSRWSPVSRRAANRHAINDEGEAWNSPVALNHADASTGCSSARVAASSHARPPSELDTPVIASAVAYCSCAGIGRNGMGIMRNSSPRDIHIATARRSTVAIPMSRFISALACLQLMFPGTRRGARRL